MTPDEIRNLSDKELAAKLDIVNINDPLHILLIEEQNRREHRQVVRLTKFGIFVGFATLAWIVIHDSACQSCAPQKTPIAQKESPLSPNSVSSPVAVKAKTESSPLTSLPQATESAQQITATNQPSPPQKIPPTNSQ